MRSPLRILHLEDDPNDAALALSTMEADGISCHVTCVQDRERFVAALETNEVDLVLSDYTLPAFDGLSALAIVLERWPVVPVILVSGTLGEELAIEALKSGATDYVLKHHPSRLAVAVRRAMHEVEEREERRRLEAQFIEAQKMEVIGHLAGGVAHDFANILGVIMGYTDLILSDLPPDSRVLPYAEEIRHASDRAVGLTRQLLIISSKETLQPVVLDLNDAIDELERMLRRLADENIELILALGQGTGRVKADAGHVGQVLMNLIVNARDAMPNGGTITVATSNVCLDEGQARARFDGVAGEYVLLSVRDSGTGISEEVKKHLFEAFFTTKGVGKGTGLGLATCQTIMKRSGGYITVFSEVGSGATFEVYFPRVETPLEASVQPVASGPLPKGTETVMVVEDEPAVRHLARGVLEMQGYEVLCASNGQDALNVAREHRGAPLRLVITDVVMPLMGGKVMAEWLQATYPEVKILFTSGYAEEIVNDERLIDAGFDFLAKPYTPAGLVRRVRATLDAPVL